MQTCISAGDPHRNSVVRVVSLVGVVSEHQVLPFSGVELTRRDDDVSRLIPVGGVLHISVTQDAILLKRFPVQIAAVGHHLQAVPRDQTLPHLHYRRGSRRRTARTSLTAPCRAPAAARRGTPSAPRGLLTT